MKIFGKRTPARKKQPEEEPQHKGDEVAEKLLLEDPSTWNAKQRRLVKRFRERQGEKKDGGGPVAASSAESSDGANRGKDEQKPVALERDSEMKQEDEDKSGDSSDDGSASSSSSDSDSSDTEEQKGIIEIGATHKGEDEALTSPGSGNDSAKNHDSSSSAAKKHTRDDPTREEDAIDGSVHKNSSTRDNFNASQVSETEKSQSGETKDATGSSGQSFSVDGDLQAILEKLNSKQRRKLVRSLERKEKDVEAVRAEARILLGLDSATDKKNDSSTTTTTTDAERPKKKRRRNNVDLSKLPAEERLRREEQRRLQQEAAQARANGSVKANTKHKHPLNSERRRANRRKPKWEAKRKQSNEHNSSGYHMRKITGGGSS